MGLILVKLTQVHPIVFETKDFVTRVPGVAWTNITSAPCSVAQQLFDEVVCWRCCVALEIPMDSSNKHNNIGNMPTSFLYRAKAISDVWLDIHGIVDS